MPYVDRITSGGNIIAAYIRQQTSGQEFLADSDPAVIAYLTATNTQFLAGEAISGFSAVTITARGSLILAQAGSGLRMPAVGVVQGNYNSGDSVFQFSFQDVITASSGLDFRWSGQAGNSLYVGSGGRIIASGGIASGMLVQKLGIAVSGGIFLNVSYEVYSGNIFRGR